MAAISIFACSFWNPERSYFHSRLAALSERRDTLKLISKNA
jgi:hypothetical protein